MTADKLAIDPLNPLMPYYISPDGRLGEALSGQVFDSAYAQFITKPNCQLFVPIIQWIDCTTTTGNDPDCFPHHVWNNIINVKLLEMTKLLGRYSQHQGLFGRECARLYLIAETWGFLSLQCSDILSKADFASSRRFCVHRVVESGLVVKVARVQKECTIMRIRKPEPAVNTEFFDNLSHNSLQYSVILNSLRIILFCFFQYKGV